MVAIIGAGIALTANQFSPHGLSLKRDYFPRIAQPAVAGNATATAIAPPAVAPDGIPAEVFQTLREKGLQPIAHAQVVEHFHDPQYGSGIVFVDARDDAHFQAGHIPGAYQLNSYEMEKFFPTVLPVCLEATKVIVYCNGGECEDSEFAAVALSQAGVPLQNLFVYVGGIAEWTKNKLAVETGGRNSGNLKPATP